MHRALLLIVLLAAFVSAPCRAHDDGLIRLQVPAGFAGPTVEQRDGLHIAAYVRAWSADGRGSLLQVSRWDFGDRVAPPPAARRGEAAEGLALQFLAGIQRRRQDFRTDPPERIRLGGVEAARITWTGKAEGHGMRGAMYALIVGNHGIALHAQDFDDAPPEHHAAARAAIEALSIVR